MNADARTSRRRMPLVRQAGTAALAWCGVALLLATLAGCTLIPDREEPERSWFLLDLAAIGEPAAHPGLQVGTTRVAPAYAGQGLVYRAGDYRVDRDFYNEWFLVPQEQIQAILVDRWHASRAAGPVRTRVDVMVTDLYLDLNATAGDTAVVGLRVLFRGLDDSDTRQRIHSVRERVSVARRDPEVIVAALSTALDQALRDVEAAARTFDAAR